MGRGKNASGNKGNVLKMCCKRRIALKNGCFWRSGGAQLYDQDAIYYFYGTAVRIAGHGPDLR